MNPKLTKLARRQYGHFRVDQAVDLGVPRAEIRRALRDCLWEELLPGVLVPAGLPISPEATSWLHELALDGAYGLAGFAGGRWHRLPGCDNPAVVHAAIPWTRRLKDQPGRKLMRIKHWDRVRTIEIEGVHVLDLSSTLMTLARLMNDAAYLAALQEAQFRKRLDLDRLLGWRGRGVPGSGRIGWAAAALVAGHDSKNEADVCRRLQNAGHQVEPTVVLSADGKDVGPVDALVDGVLVLELDGGDHDSPEAQARDEEKSAGCEAFGLAVLRLPSGPAGAGDIDVVTEVRREMREHNATPIPGLTVIPRAEWLARRH